MRWCSLQTNEHDLQAIMYPIICKYHRLNINNGNKVPVFPGYICNRWQNMIVQPSQTHNHGKIWQQWERWILPIMLWFVLAVTFTRGIKFLSTTECLFHNAVCNMSMKYFWSLWNCTKYRWLRTRPWFDGLAQDCGNSNALAMKLPVLIVSH